MGTITRIDGQVPLENTRYITFDVAKSWKGVDTKSITIHNDGSQCDSMVAIVGYEYLVFAYNKDFLKINVGCGGSVYTSYPGSSNAEYVARDIKNLEEIYEPIELVEGHTASINPFPIMAFVGGAAAVGIVSFTILIKRANRQ
jgi:hypothetical protein